MTKAIKASAAKITKPRRIRTPKSAGILSKISIRTAVKEVVKKRIENENITSRKKK